MPHDTELQKASPFSLQFQPYLPPDAPKRLAEYQYDGKDLSLIYKYFWKPLCTKLVEYLPMTLAPNVITFGALVPVIIAHFIIWWYMPYLQTEDTNRIQRDGKAAILTHDEAPGWVWVAYAAALFLYSLLDNLDGYQARRTKTSSPLGLLVDHGCDAINCVFQALSIATALQLGPTFKTLIALLVSITGFFFNTFEEFFTGSLILPPVNMPNEGIFAILLVLLLTAWNGCGMWIQEVQVLPPFAVSLLTKVTGGLLGDGEEYFKCAANQQQQQQQWGCVLAHTVPLSMTVFAGIVTIIHNCANVYTALKGKKAKTQQHGIYIEGWFVNNFPFLHALNRALPLVLFSALAILWYFVSPSNIFRVHPRLFCWTVGCLVTKQTLHLMVAHMTAMEFHPMRRSVVPFFFVALHVAVVWYFDRDEFGDRRRDPIHLKMHEKVMLVEFFVLSLSTYLHAALNITVEVATALNRKVFTISDVLAKRAAAEREGKKGE